MGGRFAHGHAEIPVLVQNELHSAGHGGFYGGNAHFAVALRGVSVARVVQRAVHLHGKIYGRALGECLDVHVAAEHGRRRGGSQGRRRNAHDAEEGIERNIEVLVLAHLFGLVVLDAEGGGFLHLIRNAARAGTRHDVAEIRGQKGVENAHFQHVAGLGAVDANGARQNMSRAAGLLQFLRGQNFIDDGIIRRQRVLFHIVGKRSRDAQHAHGLNIDHGTGIHGKHRLLVGIKAALDKILGIGGNEIVGLGRRRCGCGPAHVHGGIERRGQKHARSSYACTADEFSSVHDSLLFLSTIMKQEACQT